MKNKSLFLAILISLISQSLSSQSPNEIIGKLINEQNWYELKIQHEKLKDEVAPMLHYLSQAMLGVAFYNQEEGISAIDTLLTNEDYQTQLGFGNVCNMILIKSKLLADKFQYLEASELLKKFIAHAKDYFPEDFRKNIELQYEYYSNLSKQKPLTLNQPKVDSEVACTVVGKNNKSLLAINCVVNGQKAQMIFDTGNPGFSLITEKFANQYGIRKISDGMQISGIEKGDAWIGIADSLSLGKIVCYNPIFYVVNQIVPEKAVKEEVIEIDAILGSNILFEIGEFQYQPKHQIIVFPVKKTDLPQTGHNLLMKDDRQQYVQTFINGTRVQMHLDFGSARTAMSSNFYLANQDWITESGSRDSTKYIGFGGVSNQAIYVLPSIKLLIGNNDFVIKNIEVQTENAHIGGNEDGFLGFDFISVYDKVIVSYDKMFIAIE